MRVGCQVGWARKGAQRRVTKAIKRESGWAGGEGQLPVGLVQVSLARYPLPDRSTITVGTALTSLIGICPIVQNKVRVRLAAIPDAS